MLHVSVMKYAPLLVFLCLFAACDSDEFDDDSVCGITVDGGDSVCGCAIDVTEENACENCPPIHAQIDEWTCKHHCEVVGSAPPWEYMTHMEISSDHILFYDMDRPSHRLDVYTGGDDVVVLSTWTPETNDHIFSFPDGNVLTGVVAWINSSTGTPYIWQYSASLLERMTSASTQL